MIRIAFTFCIGVVLTGCYTSDIPNFERMSYQELADYNNGKPISQMIVCEENTSTFSRVRKRRCMTVQAAYGGVEAAGQAGVLHQIPGYARGE